KETRYNHRIMLYVVREISTVLTEQYRARLVCGIYCHEADLTSGKEVHHIKFKRLDPTDLFRWEDNRHGVIVKPHTFDTTKAQYVVIDWLSLESSSIRWSNE